MIEVKGIRAGGATEDAAEKYVLTSDPGRSKTPYGFGIAIAALGLYLRSMLTGADGADAAPEPEPRPEPGPEEAPADAQVAATLRPEPAAPEPADAAPEPESAADAGGLGGAAGPLADTSGGEFRSLFADRGWALAEPEGGGAGTGVSGGRRRAPRGG
jgi:hypothetical protein